jgi:hypothetical protein
VFLFALVVLCRVQGEFREDFPGGLVQDDGVGFRGEDQDGCAGVGPADAQVPEAAGEAKADSSCGVDAVRVGTEVGPVVAGGWGCLGCGRVGVCRGAPVQARCGRSWL